VKEMIIKILKSAHIPNPRHDIKGQRTLDHDGIAIRIIQKMRKLNMRLVHYDESPDEPVHFARSHPTIMIFEERK
jgi:hypothetical protein